MHRAGVRVISYSDEAIGKKIAPRKEERFVSEVVLHPKVVIETGDDLSEGITTS